MSMELHQLLEIGKAITYKQGWRLVFGLDGDRPYFMWEMSAPCSLTGEQQLWNSRKWHLSKHMVEGEVVQTAFAAALQAEDHEAREFFKYKGIAPFNPHIKFAAIMEAAQHIEVRS